MRSRAGFTLIELLIALAIVLILSAVVYPKFAGFQSDAQGSMLATTVHRVRQKIELHMSIADVTLSPEGYPDEVHPAWFPGRSLPKDPWTSSLLKIQIVAGPKDASEPNNKTFKLIKGGGFTGHTAWYNKSNGAFCLKVPDVGSEDDILQKFRLINGRGSDGGAPPA
jgi:prepilin-type N-terminal cleavage/methylation domain-containing protein